ncbi:MAG: hypothetical protein KBT55_06235 [Porticoccus sp.]|nr:hypothetical protein [Porticoccus sp.]
MLLILILLVLLPLSVTAGELPEVRVAALKFGTVNWELDVIRRHQLDKKHGFHLAVQELISPSAIAVSVQAGASDVMVTDWLWVFKQQQNGRYFRYFPYSTAVGELVGPCDLANQGIDGLGGKVLGVAGGSEDKNWLLYRAYTRDVLGYDLADRVTVRFAAPPLLNALADTGKIDAVLNYWHYSIVLKAKGFCSLLTLRDVLQHVALTESVPMLGWVFKREWGVKNSALANAFLAASYEAKQLLLTSDLEWDVLRPRMHVADQQLFEEMRAGYRQGIPRQFSDPEIAAIEKIYTIVAGSTVSSVNAWENKVPEDVFWRQYNLGRQ